jgi:quercetin dioxygenase-like cupin family protein
MQISNIENFKDGWFVGKFIPSIHFGDFEVGHHSHKAGDIHISHYHTESREINYIIRGNMRVNDTIFKTGDIFVLEPYEVSHAVKFFEDTELIIVRTKSIPSDKVIVKE